MSADLEHRHKQTDLPELIQDEDVCDFGRHPHAVWSDAESLQPPVSTTTGAYK